MLGKIKDEANQNDNTLSEEHLAIIGGEKIKLPRDSFLKLREAFNIAFPFGIEDLEFPFTMFAPTNLAFEKLGKETLTELFADSDALADVLKRHIVSGRDFLVPAGHSRLKSIGGEVLDIKRNIDDIFSENVKVSTSKADANIVQFNIITNNGVIHMVDSLII